MIGTLSSLMNSSCLKGNPGAKPPTTAAQEQQNCFKLCVGRQPLLQKLRDTGPSELPDDLIPGYERYLTYLKSLPATLEVKADTL